MYSLGDDDKYRYRSPTDDFYGVVASQEKAILADDGVKKLREPRSSQQENEMSADAVIENGLDSLSDDDLHHFDQDMIRHFRSFREYVSHASRSTDPIVKWRKKIINQTLLAIVRPHVRAFVCRRLNLPTPDDLQVAVSIESIQIAKDARRYAQTSNVIAIIAIAVSIFMGIFA